MLNYVKKKVIEYVDVEEEAITEDTSFTRDLHLNSYDFVNMVGKAESDLNIEIPDIDMRNIDTVGDMSNYLKNKMQ